MGLFGFLARQTFYSVQRAGRRGRRPTARQVAKRQLAVAEEKKKLLAEGTAKQAAAQTRRAKKAQRAAAKHARSREGLAEQRGRQIRATLDAGEYARANLLLREARVLGFDLATVHAHAHITEDDRHGLHQHPA